MEKSTHSILRSIHSLDASLPDYSRKLDKLLHGVEYEKCAKVLGKDDQTPLVEYLDTVRPRISFSVLHSSLCRLSVALMLIPILYQESVYVN